MKIVILAAGLGSRLRKDGSEMPKPLTRLSTGRSIMGHQVEAISKYFDFNDITVVVGYKMGLIMEEFPNLSFVYNQDFSTNNTSKSLLKALVKVKNEDVLWFNGDVVFDKGLLEKVQLQMSERKNFICVNNARVSDEEVKYNLCEEGNIVDLNKQINDGLGEAVGINFVSAESLDQFKASLLECDENDYFEKGIESMIGKGAVFKPLNISKYFCMEIDFQEDLKIVNESL